MGVTLMSAHIFGNQIFVAVMDVPTEIQALVKNLDFEFEEIEQTFLETTLQNNNYEKVDDFSDCDQKPSSSTFIEYEEKFDFEIYQCEICDEVFVANEHLQFHVNNEHGQIENDEILVDYKHITNFNEDSKRDTFKSDKIGHMTEKEHRFECKSCQKTFSSKYTLVRHKSLIHDGVKQYSCEICCKQFAQKYNLKDHFEKVHENNTYECNICKTTFSAKSNLKRHIITEHSEKKKQHKCEKCEKSYTYFYALRNHIQISHEMERNFECETCKKTFTNNTTLKCHMNVVHFKSKPFKCYVCQRNFSTKRIMDTHCKVIHSNTQHKKYQKDGECKICGKVLDQAKLAAHVKNSHDVKNKVNDLKCDICGKQFSNHTTLRRHIEVVHDKIKPFSCHICEKNFATKLSLSKHKNSIH